MVAVPAAIAVTSPADETVATEASDVAHVTVGFEITVPPASLPVATREAVSPIDVKLRLVGDRVSDIATWLTVAVAVPLTDPDVAVMVAVPLPTAVTRPAEETVTIDASDVAQVTSVSEITVPPASLTVAARVVVSPSDWKVKEFGDSSTTAATWLTIAVAVALADPDVAVMVAVPSVTAVTSPADETVATEALDVAHVTVGFDSVSPAASVTVATRVAPSPIELKLRLVGTRVIEAVG